MTLIAPGIDIRYSTDMNSTNKKTTTHRTLYIAALVIMLAAIAGLGYYTYSTQQQHDTLVQQQASAENELMNRIAALEDTSEEVHETANHPDTHHETAAVDDTAAIVAAATQFADSNGLAYTGPLQVTDRYGDFADVAITSAGLTLKKLDGTWTVVSHGQQLNLDDARTHGIPIDASSALYQSLSAQERQGLVTR